MYDYDRFGNRWHQNGPHAPQFGFDANNRIVAGSGVAYDAAGNTINDGSHTYAYDAEGRVSQVDGGNTASYVYDAEGRRVRKTTGGSSVDFLYDLAGHEITEINSSGGWNRGEVYAGGRHLATYSGGTGGTTYFIHADWLGTERARSNVAGASYETCTSLPFGDWLTCSGGDPSPMHFTGKEHDNETNLENFGARYDASSMGRFMSPDPLMASAHVGDPQSWNRYSYVLNNPLGLVDPTGMDPGCGTGDDSKCKVIIRVNIIYDKNANRGKGLTDKEKSEFGKTLAKAQKDFGKSGIGLSVTYTAGTMSPVGDDGQVHTTGERSDSLNVMVSDTLAGGHSGDSPPVQRGLYMTFIGVDDAHSATFFPFFANTVEHEFTHHLKGDTQNPNTNPFSYEANEFNVDFRVLMMGWGVRQNSLVSGAENKSFSVQPQQRSIRPRTDR
jgi:RHS repeat-associated protein